MCGEKKGNRRLTTLSLLNADAKALCLRPDPELVKVFGIPRRRRSVESCPSAAADELPAARRRPAAAPAGYAMIAARASRPLATKVRSRRSSSAGAARRQFKESARAAGR